MKNQPFYFSLIAAGALAAGLAKGPFTFGLLFFGFMMYFVGMASLVQGSKPKAP